MIIFVKHSKSNKRKCNIKERGLINLVIAKGKIHQPIEKNPSLNTDTDNC